MAAKNNNKGATPHNYQLRSRDETPEIPQASAPRLHRHLSSS